jgi:hypothetical protein
VPTERERAPMDEKPELSTRTMVSFWSSWTEVMISALIIRYEPSPTMT